MSENKNPKSGNLKPVVNIGDDGDNSAAVAQTQNQPDSTTVDNFVLSGPRGSCSFKGNKLLWKSFVSFSKLNYGSVCHIIEPMLLAIMQAQVVQSSTIRPIVIENLVIERAVKRVRRYSEETTTEKIVSIPVSQVRVKKRVNHRLDYSGLSLDQLETRYLQAKRFGDVVTPQIIQGEAERRGIRFSYDNDQVKRLPFVRRRSP